VPGFFFPGDTSLSKNSQAQEAAIIIGLVAPTGSGKSAVARHLKKAHGFELLHAGRPVKDGLKAMFPELGKAATTGDMRIDQPHLVLGGVAPRSVSDPISEAVHEHAPAATAIQLGKALDKHIGKGRDIVVDGVRSPKEAEAIRRRGGVILRIRRPGVEADPELAMDRMQADIKADHQVVNPPKRESETDAEKAQRRAGRDAAVDRLIYERLTP
jgi:hypothetical protein